MIHFVTVLLSILSTTAYASVQPLRSPYQRHLAMKEHIPDLPARIHDNAQDFLYFVQKTDLFIDKTPYIAHLLQIPEKVLFVTGPRGWGKTFNWGMVSSFLNTEYDEIHQLVPLNQSKIYHLFANGEFVTEDDTVEDFQNPLSISHNGDLINEYLGKSSVIRLNFANIRGDCAQDMITRMSDAIATAYQKHSYLSAVFAEIKKNKQLPKETLIEVSRYDELFWKVAYDRTFEGLLRFVLSVETLSLILSKYMKKKVYIFIDGYDDPIVQMFANANFPENDKAQFLHNYDRFMYCTFIENPYYEKAFITGTVFLDKRFFFSKFPDIKHLHCLDQQLYSFYGFSQREIQDMMKYTNIPPSRMDQLFKCYSGFTVFNTNKTVYNPAAITNAVRTGKVCGYWWENKFVERFLKICLRNAYFRQDFIALINDDGLEIQMDDVDEIKIIELKMLKTIMQFENLPKVDMSLDMVTAVFKLLHLWGYLVKVNISGASPGEYFLQFPDNNVMKERLANGQI